MTDKLKVDRRGHLSFRGVRLHVCFDGQSVIFPIKNPGDRKRLESKRVHIPLAEFQKLRRRAAESATTTRETASVVRKRRRGVDKTE